MPGLCAHAVEPTPNGWKRSKIEVAFVGEMRVREQRNVDERVAVGHEVSMMPQMRLHDRERTIAFLHPVFERMLLQIAAALHQREPEIRRAEIGLEAVLLEEHPLQRFGLVETVLGSERGAAAQVPQDRVR